jgi:hypothetical protein
MKHWSYYASPSAAKRRWQNRPWGSSRRSRPKNIEAKRLDTTMDKLIQDKSLEELRAYLKATIGESEYKLTDDDDA